MLTTTTCVYAEPDNNADLEKLKLTANTFDEDLLTLDFRFDLPEYSILNHVTWNDWRHVPGAYRLELVGLQKMLLNQVQRKIQHQAEDDLRRQWNLSNMPYSEFSARMSGINSSYNPYGEWWERSWMHSLPPEKGGAPRRPVVERVGWDIEITRHTPFVGWFKQQFDRLGDIWISADHEFDEERGTGVQRNDGRVDNNPEDIGKLKIQEANIGIERPWRWFESGFYHFRFKPTMKFASDTRTGFVDEVALRVQTELFYDDKKKHFATVSLFVRHDFKDENTFFSIFFELVNF
jgi:hypothetical protein